MLTAQVYLPAPLLHLQPRLETRPRPQQQPAPSADLPVEDSSPARLLQLGMLQLPAEVAAVDLARFILVLKVIQVALPQSSR